MGIFADDVDLIKLAIGIFWSLLFLQSGLDKIFDWKGNMEWLKGHFANSFLKSVVTPMLGVLTITELIAGALCVAGTIQVVLSVSTYWLAMGLIVSIISILMLFFGQRIAKDYDGAKTIAIFFAVALMSCMFLMQSL